MKNQETVTEVAIYKIKDSHLNEFEEVREKNYSVVSKFPGFVALETKRHVTDERMFIDLCQWKSKEHAFAALELFRRQPISDIFKACFDGETIFLGHFGEP